MQAPVSVVVPCFCCSETIGRALASIIDQTLKPSEVLLVDDGSSDKGETINLLRELQHRHSRDVSIKIYSLGENCGPSVARNSGWEAATQPFIAFLDADDAWHPKKLEIQYNWMKTHPQVALTGHATQNINPESDIAALPERWCARPVSVRRLLLSNQFPTRTVMLCRDISYRFEPTKRHSEDYLLWLRIVLDGYAAWRLELPLAYSFKARFGGSGLSKDLWKMEQGELDTYRRLYRQGHLSGFLTVFLILFSLLKYFRRLAFRRIGSNWRNRFEDIATNSSP